MIFIHLHLIPPTPMKKLLLLLFICAYTVATAQIVNIPDNVFKTQLLTGTDMDFKDLNGMQVATVDTNRNGEIQSSEALAIGQMIIGIDYYDDSVESLAGPNSIENKYTFFTHYN
jgi:hypothetical protein